MKIIDKKLSIGEPTKGYIRGFGYDIIDSVLENSRGFMIYQEEVMAVFGGAVYSDVASNFSEALQHADYARKVMAKKKPEELPQLLEQWIEGCERSLIDHVTRDILWAEIAASSSYNFNRAHAANYSLYSAQLAWFRWNYPIQFAAQRLNIKDDEKDIWIRYCAINDIKVKPPKANVSTTKWQVEGETIFAPIQLIHGMASKAKKIVAKQPFSSVKDFEDRITGRECSTTNKLFLWMMGYFDNIDGDFEDLKTPFEIEDLGDKILIWKYKSQAQKRNDGKLKTRKNKETGEKEEYIYVGEKELAYELNSTFDFYYHFMNGSVLYSKKFADIVQKLDENGFEISFVNKVKENDNGGYDIYCDGNVTKPKLKIYKWMVNKYDDVFVPEPKTYIAYMRSERFRYGIAFAVEEPRSFEKNGETINWTYRKGFQLRDITHYLEEDLK